MARAIMDQLVKNGKVSRGYIGVGIEAVTPDLAKAFGMDTPEGALVGEVEPDSPGSKGRLAARRHHSFSRRAAGFG